MDTENPPLIPEFYFTYEKIVPSERLALSQLATEWSDIGQPLKNQNICFNGHLTLATIILIDILILAGATLTVTSTPNLVTHGEIHDLLVSMSKKYKNIHYFPKGTIPQSQHKDYFDIIIDCGAGLLDLGIIPKSGCVELTRTEKYKKEKLVYPVISVDETITKVIETFFGTGDGFCKALCKNFLNEPMLSKQEQDSLYHQYRTFLIMPRPKNMKDHLPRKLQKKFKQLQQKHFIIFGYGKVGKGIAYNLELHGIQRGNILIVDIKNEACNQARNDGYEAIQLTVENLTLIKQKINSCDYVVTATGVEACVSEWFTAHDFQGIRKFNMGTPNEWGNKFNIQDIFNNANPANFCEEYPTQVKFLDPIFTILLIATRYIILTHENLKPGFQGLPKEKDILTIAYWTFNHPEYREKVYKLISEENRVWFNHEIRCLQLKKDQLLKEFLVEKTSNNTTKRVPHPLIRATA